MGASFCSGSDNYDAGDWDQTNLHKAGSSNTQEPSKARAGVRPRTGKQFQFLDLEPLTFLTSDQYFKKQNPNLNVKVFTDDTFKPDTNSIDYVNPNSDQINVIEDQERQDLASLKWKRVTDILKNNFKLYEVIEVGDIHQGIIGNCYFLSALSAVAEYKNRFDSIFVSKVRSTNGAYQLRINIQGKPKIITIDDNCIVYKDNEQFAGATSGQGEIWVQVLEKAWAKANGSYAMTIAGTPGEALAALTDAPVVSYIHKKYGNNLDELWNIIKESDERKYIMCTNTGGNKDAESMGLVNGHAYTLIGCHESKDGIRLVQLRNPWGNFEWKGDFSDNSPSWTKFPGLKKQAGVQTKDDGIFYMTFEDYLKYYPYTFISTYENGFNYRFVKVNQKSEDFMTGVKFNVTEVARVILGLHKKQSRFYTKVKGYKPQMGRILLAKYTSGQNPCYEFIQSDSSNNDKLCINEVLAPGEYHLFSNTSWPYQTKCNYVVSTYALKPVEIQKLDPGVVPENYLTQILSSYLSKNTQSKKLSLSSTYQISLNDNDTGFYMLKVNNQGTDFLKVSASFAMNSKVQFISKPVVFDHEANNVQGTSNETCSFQVEPMKSNLIIWRLKDNPWNSKLEMKNLSCSVLSENKKTNSIAQDTFRPIIDKNLKSLEKDNITLDLFYSELKIDDGVILVFNNTGTSNTYKVKVDFPELANLKNTSGPIFIVKPSSYEYVRLKKEDANNEFSYTMAIAFKKV